ncbi:MAG: hypothetical protein MH204_00860, partial [Fimbriimonadaceae bacterium]|nr:hypothetical protein [Fimbriimonadaceae bacterium]
MLSYQFYHFFHLGGLATVLLALGAMPFVMLAPEEKRKGLRRPLGILHGVALAIMVISGFGLLARLGITDGLPLWVILKLGVWVVLGVWPMAAYRLGAKSPVLTAFLPLAFALTAFYIGG